MLVRLKDRPAVITPQSEAQPVPFVVEKKTILRNPEEEEEEERQRTFQFAEDQPPGQGSAVQYFPDYTQQRRKERTIVSSELKHRTDVAPCIEDRLKLMKKYEEEKAKMLEREAVMARKKKEQEEKLAALQKALETGDTSLIDNDEDDDEDKLMDQVGDVELDEEDIAELKRMALDMKEKKITSQRNSVLVHRPMRKIKRIWRAFRLSTGTSWKNNDCDQVLPWMYLGRADVAKNCQYLMKHNFTHILNVSKEIPNYHKGKFIYKRIPIIDSIHEDVACHFRTIIDFIRRVASCKGKLYVHCTVGASRAPMAIMVYFVVVRKISLLDIYRYLQAVRPVVGPNKHFLFQLAEIEYYQGLGSSVLYHKDWRHYEYNEMRAEDMPYRKSEGLYKTVKRVLSPENALRDKIDDLEEAIERKRAMFAAKAEKKKRKLRESHGGK